MIINEIVLHNFRAYKGKHRISLMPKTPGRPITLIGGLNGGGKTSLLTALQLAFHGSQSHVWKSESRSYSRFLEDSIHRDVSPAHGAGLEVEFQHVIEGEEMTVRILRYWRKKGSKIEDTLEVYTNGQYDSACSEHWDEQIEEFFPARIAPLFFFDGEKLEELANPDSSAAILKTAVHSLLGLETVDQLQTDLLVLERRTKANMAEGDARKELNQLQQNLDDLQSSRAAKVRETAEANNEVELARKRLDEVKAQLTASGGDLYEQSEALSTRREELLVERKALESSLRDLAADCLPFALVSPQIERCLSGLRQDQGKHFSEAQLQLIAARDQELLASLEQMGVQSKNLKKLAQAMTTDLGDWSRSPQRNQAWPGQPERMTEDLHHLLRHDLVQAKEQLKRLVDAHTDLCERIDEVEKRQAGIPQKESILPLIEQRGDAQLRLTRSQARYELLSEQVDLLRGQVEKAERALDSARIGNELLENQAEDGTRLMKHSKRARKTVGTFRTAVIRQHAATIARFTQESLERLMRKQRLIRSLSIDPETYAVSLHDDQGNFIRPEDLSAGERQILATSLLWGLSQASGRRLPVIIDTPLGRLDSEHRAFLLQRYFPYASHQVVLLSTDEEITQEHAREMEEQVSNTYTLDFDDESQSTTVVAGYLV